MQQSSSGFCGDVSIVVGVSSVTISPREECPNRSRVCAMRRSRWASAALCGTQDDGGHGRDGRRGLHQEDHPRGNDSPRLVSPRAAELGTNARNRIEERG